MTYGHSIDHNEVEQRRDADRHHVEVGVPLVRRPAPATPAAEVVSLGDDDVKDRGTVSGRELR